MSRSLRRRHAVTGLLVGVALVISCSAEQSEEPRDELGFLPGYGGTPPVTVSVGFGGAGGMATSSTGPSSSSSAGGGQGVGGGMGCVDFGEPNDSEAQAYGLGSITDCDGTGSAVGAALDGSGDVDWYFYAGSDNFGCVVDPTRALTASGSLRLCKFAKCVSGSSTSVSCNDGATAATAPNGWQGCCHNQGFQMDIGCSGLDDDADILLRVDQPGAACVTYNLTYHY